MKERKQFDRRLGLKRRIGMAGSNESMFTFKDLEPFYKPTDKDKQQKIEGTHIKRKKK